MFIILPVGWEYDDEVYHTGNYGPMYDKPTHIFKTKEEALKGLQAENLKKIKSFCTDEGLGMYGWDGPLEHFTKPDYVKVIFDKYGVDTEGWDIDMTKLPIEAIHQLAPLLKGFYEIHEMEL